jgi:hypothetical protein
MKIAYIMSTLATVAILFTGHLNAADKNKVATALQFKMKTLAGKEVKLEKYQGQVLLIVNVASECG